MLVPGAAFEGRQVLVDNQSRAQPAFGQRKGAFAEAGQDEKVEPAPILLHTQIDHRLAELVLLVDILQRVGLVDDVDQMARFGDTPEDLVDAAQQVPVTLARRDIGLADVEMGAFVVPAGQPQEGDEDRAGAAVLAAVADLGLRQQRRFDAAELALELRRLGKPTQFGRHEAGNADVAGEGGGGDHGKYHRREQRHASADWRAEFHRIRFSTFFTKSRSRRPVLKANSPNTRSVLFLV